MLRGLAPSGQASLSEVADCLLQYVTTGWRSSIATSCALAPGLIDVLQQAGSGPPLPTRPGLRNDSELVRFARLRWTNPLSQ
jgi:hypothetical protein